MHFLKSTAHRPWALPVRPWLMRQEWRKLLFAHWPIAPEAMAARLPPGLALDTYDGQAWVGIVPFVLTYTLRGLHPLPFRVAFNELNVRTYATLDGKPGVYFFSLEATDPFSVWAARRLYHLPYFNADIIIRSQGQEVICVSRRTHRHAPPALFEAEYHPTSAVYASQPGSMEHWLTERYCLYSADPKGRLYRADIHHAPWPLQQAQATIRQNTMAVSHGLILPDCAPILHYAEHLDMVAWPLRLAAE